MSKAFEVVKMFEAEVAKYTGAPYVVAVNSCTNALFLCLAWYRFNKRIPERIEIPKRTYVSIPMQIMLSGAKPIFRDEKWEGRYQLAPLPIWDAARQFHANMYDSGNFVCTSHHWNKILGISQGGCILHDDKAADDWFRRARFDGRSEGLPPSKDKFRHIGWHMYMSPEIAAAGLVRIATLKPNNPPLPWDDYPDLSEVELFK